MAAISTITPGNYDLVVVNQQYFEQAVVKVHHVNTIVDAMNSSLSNMETALNSGLLLEYRVYLTSAQIKGLSSHPVVAVKAPGANKTIVVISSMIEYTRGSQPFTNTQVLLGFDGRDPQASVTGVWDAGASVSGIIPPDRTIVAAIPTIQNQLATNAPLKISSDDDSVEGNGSATVVIYARITNV